jgi:hypothetical protein
LIRQGPAPRGGPNGASKCYRESDV